MSIPDPLIVLYLDVYTAIPRDQVSEVDVRLGSGELNPRDAKRLLARAVVERYHGPAVAEDEDAWFLDRFSRRQVPDDAPLVQIPRAASVVEVVLACLPGESRSHVRRLIAQGAVRYEGERLDDPDATLETATGALLRVGKRRWFALQVADPPPPDRPGT